MVRLCSGDWYPFRTGLQFGIESGNCNDQFLEHSGIVFYYGVDEPGTVLTDQLDIGDSASEAAHSYKAFGMKTDGYLESTYEGDNDHIKIIDRGCHFEEFSEFTVHILSENNGVRLRRRSDQNT